MARWVTVAGMLTALLVAGCGSSLGAPAGIPEACQTPAREYDGTVAGGFTDDVAAIRELPAVAVGGQLARFQDDRLATVCWIDGTIPKGPPPGDDGSIPPSYDRAVIVIVDGEVIPIALGYRGDLPVPP